MYVWITKLPPPQQQQLSQIALESQNCSDKLNVELLAFDCQKVLRFYQSLKIAFSKIAIVQNMQQLPHQPQFLAGVTNYISLRSTEGQTVSRSGSGLTAEQQSLFAACNRFKVPFLVFKPFLSGQCPLFQPIQQEDMDLLAKVLEDLRNQCRRQLSSLLHCFHTLF
ncbi:Hypothetical_protein [Hexamita inflata]|uniref:Hypothetical_protein n=1 Tax=Hexamita inflata TaxID=28002 RepID=A0ABP1HEE9_9EUKA